MFAKIAYKQNLNMWKTITESNNLAPPPPPPQKSNGASLSSTLNSSKYMAYHTPSDSVI